MGKTLTERLQKLKDQQQGIFVPYIMAGDHEKGLAGLQETIQFLEELGVSAIEVGIPFSDPVADGPVIEEAGLRSLSTGVSTVYLLSVRNGIREICISKGILAMTTIESILETRLAWATRISFLSLQQIDLIRHLGWISFKKQALSIFSQLRSTTMVFRCMPLLSRLIIA